ncbi:hypothetical protein K470DRAFT_254428 [Piedraia hortae CBS 480.64]|uniref:KOW domain-containing protein n=1 Tax=Piedraia hortae CBS 480.64 TaxID=1314780 RepID=A0A6A7CC83_9PEZI|nr:hypothetical protein K470DRAFT_254428 [Piedraia hortae CBS 480.64]
MDKVLQRAASAHRSTSRKLKKQKAAQKRGELFINRENFTRTQRQVKAVLDSARQNRRIDWETNTLAPRRDVGKDALTFGALPMHLYRAPELPYKKERVENLIRVGDRVVVTKGRDRSKIGKVTEVDADSLTCNVKGLNIVDVIIPAWQNQKDNREKPEVTAASRGVPLEDVRLVFPLRDPKDPNKVKDVVIEALEKIPGKGVRAIKGTNVIIPWPPKGKEEILQESENDTTMENVQEGTFSPPLLYEVMPTSVIDELRNKYSRFRTRFEHHEVEKIEQKKAANERREKLMDSMLTPLQENAQIRKTSTPKRELTDQQLEQIGQIMLAGRN